MARASGSGVGLAGWRTGCGDGNGVPPRSVDRLPAVRLHMVNNRCRGTARGGYPAALFAGLLALVAVIVDGAPARAGSTTAPDDSTPSAALSGFRSALEQGDAARLGELVTGDTKERAWVLAQAAHLKALRELDGALAKRFAKEYADSDAGRDIRDEIDTARDGD